MVAMTMMPNKRAGANGHRPFSFDRDMKFDYHSCIAALAAGGRGSALDR
jgi:hypothetical protein